MVKEFTGAGGIALRNSFINDLFSLAVQKEEPCQKRMFMFMQAS
jgi:hypothetical protein